MLEDLAKNDDAAYQVFWKAFGQVLKEGIGEDAPHRDRIAKLLRVNSTHSDVPGQTTSLAEYVERMKPEQTKIYYLTAENEQAAPDEAQMSGYLQRLLKASGQAAPEFKPILELNPNHTLVARLQPEQADFSEWCHLLFDQALLAEGGTLENPAGYVQRTNALLMANFEKASA
ncbi:hypothetical protein BGZ92_005181 [Podila epicladia]|nr:hypothetical protein BGZ92_005181 [Podila epicladia]